MRRLKAALYAFMVLSMVSPDMALAKVAVIVSTKQSPDDTNSATAGSKIVLQTILSVLRETGADYDVVNANSAKTKWLQTGTFNFGSAANTRNVTYDAAIVLSGLIATFGSGMANGLSSFRLDSLMRSIYPAATVNALSIPILAFTNQTGSVSGGALADSTGANGGNFNASGNQVRYLGTDPTLRYIGSDDQGLNLDTLKAAGQGASGIRTILGIRNGSLKWDTQGNGVTCGWCDSLTGSPNPGFSSGKDSVLVWETQRSHINGSKSITFAHTNDLPYSNLDPIPILVGMAHLDSLSGGKVFGPKPIRFGILVLGGMSRNLRTIGPGISPNDTAQMRYAADSMATLKVPFSVTMNVDSVASYPYSISYWNHAAPYVRFIPQTWAGIATNTKYGAPDSATTSGGNWIANEPRDVYGAMRTRAFYGDGSATGADSSIWAGQRRLYNKMDSLAAGQTDHMLVAPLFDWVPKNMRAYSMGNQDSLITYLAKAGVRNILVNLADHRTDPSFGYHNPKSLVRGKATFVTGIGASKTGQEVPVICTLGIPDSSSGAAMQYIGYGTGNGDDPNINNPLHLNEVFMRGLFTRRANGGIASTYSGGAYPDSLGSVGGFAPAVLTVTAGGFGSGVGGALGTRPTMPAWWQIKWVVNACKIVNAAAGRNIIQVVPTETLTNR